MREEARATEAIIRGVSQQNWLDSMKKSGLDKLELPQSVLNLMQQAFELGHNSGQVLMLDVLKDIYDNDVDTFEDIFDPYLEGL